MRPASQPVPSAPSTQWHTSAVYTLQEFVDTIVGESVAAEFHARRVGDFLPIAHDSLTVQLEAANLVALHHASTSKADEALLLLIGHAANLFFEAVRLIFRGAFDVAVYLLRPLNDCSALVRFVAVSEERAQLFLAGGEVKAAEARRNIVEEIRDLTGQESNPWSDDPFIVEEVDKSLRSGAETLNLLSHVSVHHVGRMIEFGEEFAHPTFGGREDETQAVALLRAVALTQSQTLGQMRIGMAHMLPPDMKAGIDRSREAIEEWIIAHS